MYIKIYANDIMKSIINRSYNICKNISEEELSYEKIERGIIIPFGGIDSKIGGVFRENGTI